MVRNIYETPCCMCILASSSMAIVDGSVTADVKAYLASNPVAIDLKDVELKVVNLEMIVNER